MARNVFKSFDKIGVDCRGGVIISETTKGWKVETFSAYADTQEYIYYVQFTKNFPQGTDMGEIINDYGIKKYDHFLNSVDFSGDCGIKPYRIIKK